jgi:hypothetical protein
MQTSPSGRVPRGQSALLAAGAPDAAVAAPRDPAPRTTTRRSGPTASAEMATRTAATAPARTSVDTGRA